MILIVKEFATLAHSFGDSDRSVRTKILRAEAGAPDESGI